MQVIIGTYVRSARTEVPCPCVVVRACTVQCMDGRPLRTTRENVLVSSAGERWLGAPVGLKIFFSHNKLINIIFSYGFSYQRTGVGTYVLRVCFSSAVGRAHTCKWLAATTGKSLGGGGGCDRRFTFSSVLGALLSPRSPTT